MKKIDTVYVEPFALYKTCSINFAFVCRICMLKEIEILESSYQ